MSAATHPMLNMREALTIGRYDSSGKGATCLLSAGDIAEVFCPSHPDSADRYPFDPHDAFHIPTRHHQSVE